MKITVSTEEARKGFYPTPPELAAKLLEGIETHMIHTILEPSCGSGNLIRAFARKVNQNQHHPHYDVDLVEIDPALRGMVKENFIATPYSRYWDQYKVYIDKQYTKNGGKVELSTEDMEASEEAYAMYRVCTDMTLRFAHEDFTQYDTMKKYDLILMNPPFADGDAHLLKAIGMQKRFGGKIRCILNAETLLNPYTNRRKLLVKELAELNAEVTYEEGAFADAERPTGVRVALIKIDIPAPTRLSGIFERCRKAEEVKFRERTPMELTVADEVERIVSQYRVEVNAGIALIEDYMALQPYILSSFEKTSYPTPMLELTVDGSSGIRGGVSDINRYVKAVRRKYWRALCIRKEFFGQLTTNLQDELRSRTEQLVEYEFDSYNIHTLLREMSAKMEDGVKATILDLFEELTHKYHWRDDENVQNIHYYNGWAHNLAHKVNKKVILPCYGVFSTYSWEKGKFQPRAAYGKLADIEKALNYLDGNRTVGPDLWNAMERAGYTGKFRNIPCKYFTVDFYKKGTMHICFTNEDLLDRFNIYVSRNKNWLPPSYGRKKYSAMNEEEKAVIDSFHGDDTAGSGEDAYENVVANAGYYLAPVTQQTVALPSGM